MKRLLFQAVTAALFLGLFEAYGLAQTTKPPTATAGDESFETLFTQWKSMLGSMRSLQEKYQFAGASERVTIEAEFNRLREQGRVTAPKLVLAAEKAYLADPTKNQAIGDFLMAYVADCIRNDEYEEGLRLAKFLIERGYKDTGAQGFAGMAMFALADFDGAQKNLMVVANDQKIDKLVAKERHPSGMEMLQMAPMEAEKWEAEKKIRAAEKKADDLPRVKISTTKGDIVVELFENEAPNTVANFISLVEKGFYNGLKFHRVIPGFMAQGGDPKGDGSGGPDYTIDCECARDDHRNNFRGSLSMAHAGPNTGGSQFFLTFVPTPHLDGKHTVFGRVIEGMDVLAKLQRTEQSSRPGPPDKIIKAEVLRKRAHEYKPVTHKA